MREDFLHYVWQFKKFRFNEAETASRLPVVLVDSGKLNRHSGPDFFNSRLKIGGQLWAGNVEIHINSSDWYAHGHESDPNYDNVILHVVWDHDMDIFRKDNSIIPVLELKNLIDESAYEKYQILMSDPVKNWINCEKDFASFDSFEMDHWLERMYFERLEEKSAFVYENLEASSNNWEEVLFKMLCKNFGLNLNGEAFRSLALSIPFSVVRKVKQKEKLEALFFGQAGLLEQEIEEPYYKRLQEDFHFLKRKYGLGPQSPTAVKYFRLRPDNFPTLRLAQLAALYSLRGGLFSEVKRINKVEEFYRLFEVQVSGFWESHYTFQKPHALKKKFLTRSFVDLLIINTLIPVRFCYAAKQGQNGDEEIVELISGVRKENNQIIKRFEALRPKTAGNALQSQGLLQLKQHYCDKNRCLKCSLGIKLLQG